MAITNKDLYEEVTKLRRELEQADSDLEDKIDRTYVRLERYLTVEKIVFALIGAVMFAVVSAILVSILGVKV